MRNLIMYKKGERSWTRYIQKRVTKANKNFLCVFTGQTGIGKTLGAIEESINIDPDFNVEEQLSFSFRGIMRIINNFQDKSHPLSKKKYKIVIYDEPQIDLSNRDWQSKANKLFNFLLSTFRHQNIIMFFCLPYVDFLDSASVKLLHSEFKCKGWNEKTKKSIVRPVLLQYNSKQKRMYEHSLYVIRNGGTHKYINMPLGECRRDQVVKYEVMKTNFTDKLNKKILRELSEFENEGEQPMDIAKGRRAMTDKQLECMELIASLGSVDAAAKSAGITQGAMSDRKLSAEKKGYRVSEFYTKKQISVALDKK